MNRWANIRQRDQFQVLDGCLGGKGKGKGLDHGVLKRDRGEKLQTPYNGTVESGGKIQKKKRRGTLGGRSVFFKGKRKRRQEKKVRKRGKRRKRVLAKGAEYPPSRIKNGKRCFSITVKANNKQGGSLKQKKKIGKLKKKTVVPMYGRKKKRD